jgi:hypothetical protein
MFTELIIAQRPMPGAPQSAAAPPGMGIESSSHTQTHKTNNRPSSYTSSNCVMI